jgi:hypothetical protein
MAKNFRILTIVLSAMVLMAGGALAGPTGPGQDNGDPDIPNSPLKQRAGVHAPSDVMADSAGASAKVASGTISDAKQDRWVRILRAYFRLVRTFGL